jgi:hypothetical protein
MMMWEIGEDVPADDPQSLLGNAQRVLFGAGRTTLPADMLQQR